ncbi:MULTISPECIES: response regulator [Arenibacter]|uniref:response regulator n=1 Tax=Arenibacter TaxID=178469 RepID=UPI001C06B383|nr:MULTISPECIES: response regulator [Arenibacter]MBU2903264.1 response regulator [Arenibacter algicola]MCK0134415.1 response regulator [Arenibacter sp. S6351L]
MTHRLLQIDDDPVILFLHNKLFSKYTNSKIEQFKNGKLALDHILDNNGPDISYMLLLDINMPVMNGWELMDEICNLGLAKSISVVILTSSADYADLDKSKSYANIVHFIQKPLTKEKIEKIPLLMEYLNLQK